MRACLLHPPDGARSHRHRRGHCHAARGAEAFPSSRSCSATRRLCRYPRERKKLRRCPVILITYATSEDAVRRALQLVQHDKVISGRPQVIRIEKN